MLYPLLWMLAASFRPENEIFSSHLALAELDRISAPTSAAGSASQSASAVSSSTRFVISVSAVIGNVIACSLAAYAFARLEFRGRNFWFALMLGTLMLPYQVTLIPQYVLFLNLGWVNTYPAAGRAEIPRGRRLLHLPDGAVLPRHPARARRGGDDGRLLALAHLLEDHAAAVAAGAGDRRDLHLHLDLGRFLRAADLPQRHEATTPIQLGLRTFVDSTRQVRLGRAVRHVDAVAGADLRLLPVLPAPADRGHRHDRHEAVTAASTRYRHP